MLLVGVIDKRQLGCKRLGKYSKEHYIILSQALQGFEKLVTTPHILTEISNLGGLQLEGRHLEKFFILLNSPGLFDIKSDHDRVIERHITRRDVAVSHISKFGLTDAAIIKLCTTEGPGRPLLISDDVGLYNMVLRLKGDAVNFNHIFYQLATD
jgi:hypothetical protein